MSGETLELDNLMVRKGLVPARQVVRFTSEIQADLGEVADRTGMSTQELLNVAAIYAVEANRVYTAPGNTDPLKG